MIQQDFQQIISETKDQIEGLQDDENTKTKKQAPRNGFQVEKLGSEGQLRFQGKYVNDVKVGQWLIYSNGINIGGGDFNESGVKHGRWKEAIDTYHQMQNSTYIRLCNVTFIGKYNNGVRVGQWNTLYILDVMYNFNYLSGGGMYNENGEKEGLWTEIDENYQMKDIANHISFKITHTGHYKNGMRVGQWTTIRKSKKHLGGGVYNDMGLKNGKWVEIPFQIHFKHPSFQKIIIYSGDYENGLRIGHWKYEESQKIIGGGQFNENGQKQGLWTELDLELFRETPISHTGEYMNDIRVGRWESKASFFEDQLVGGGTYNEKGLKQDQWTEFLLIIHKCSSPRTTDYLIYSGKYQNGVQNGVWQIKQNFLQWNIVCECNFNQDGRKDGKWRDYFSNINNVYYETQFQNGIPIAITFPGYQMEGKYDANGVKQGYWIEYNYEYKCFVFGEYENGLKIGEWNMQTSKYEQNIGGGIYDEYGMKQGKWEEPHPLYRPKQHGGGMYDNQGVMEGEWKEIINDKFEIGHGPKSYEIYDKLVYSNGVLISRTTTNKNVFIQSGTFNDLGQKQGYCSFQRVVKDEKWKLKEYPIELFPIYFSGNYDKDRKIGSWTYTCFGKQIGGGNYDLDEKKDGHWIDLIWKRHNLTKEGHYQKGVRVGQWITKFDGFQIGGGNYDESGRKQGIWTKVSVTYRYDKQITWRGEYKNDFKVGPWEQFLKRQYIGGGTYDQQGRRQGIRIEARDSDNWNLHQDLASYKDGVFQDKVFEKRWWCGLIL